MDVEKFGVRGVAWCFYTQRSKDSRILRSESLITKQSQLPLEDYARASFGFHSCMLLYHTMMSVSLLSSLSDLRAYGEAHGLFELISSYVAQRVLHANQLCLTAHVHVDLLNAYTVI